MRVVDYAYIAIVLFFTYRHVSMHKTLKEGTKVLERLIATLKLLEQRAKDMEARAGMAEAGLKG